MADITRGQLNGELASKPTVQSVDRTLDILEALAEMGEVGIGQLSTRVGLHASTVHRLLATLISRGYVRQNAETGRYLLGLKLLDVAGAVRDHLDMRMEALPILRNLMKKSGETANLGVRDRRSLVYIEQASSPGRLLRMFVQVGGRAPLHSTASGKILLAHLPEAELQDLLSGYTFYPNASRTIVDRIVLLAELEEVRRQGYATDYGEQEDGVNCIAGPVRDHTGRVVAAVSISGPWIRISPQRVPELVPLVLDACSALSLALGHRADPRSEPSGQAAQRLVAGTAERTQASIPEPSSLSTGI